MTYRSNYRGSGSQFICIRCKSHYKVAVKNYKSVVKDGVRCHKQKRLLSKDLCTLHKDFAVKFPKIKISLSQFRKSRPKQCILAGSKGTQNVCVCKIHHNIHLKFAGLVKELTETNVQYKCHSCLAKMTCSNPTSDCFLTICKDCLGVSEILSNLELELHTHNISLISFNKCISTNR